MKGEFEKSLGLFFYTGNSQTLVTEKPEIRQKSAPLFGFRALKDYFKFAFLNLCLLLHWY